MPDDTPDDESADETLRIAMRRLGLSAHEAILYTTLVGTSSASASWLAKRCALPRSSTYTALDVLVSRGLIGFTHEGEVKRFVSLGHGALLDLLRREERLASERVALAEQLKERFERPSRSGKSPNIVTFEGQDGLKQVYLSMLARLPERATLRLLRDEFVFSPDWAFVSSADWRRQVSSLKEGKEIETRLLTNRSDEEIARSSYYGTRPSLERRFLPASLRLDRFALYVGGDVVAVMSMERGHLSGVRIDDPRVASNVAGIFDVLWVSCAP